MGALRTDLDGNQDSYLGADRDHALFALGLATGIRRNNLANITIHEIPPVGRLPLTTMRVADHITKGDAGGDALAFTHHNRREGTPPPGGGRGTAQARRGVRPRTALATQAGVRGAVTGARRETAPPAHRPRWGG